MTRKHFQTLADAIAIEYTEPRPVGPNPSSLAAALAKAERAAIRRVTDNIASACAEFNPRFDRAKFLTRATPEAVVVDL